MKVKQIMTTDVKVIAPDALIARAAQDMRALGIGSLPVCDGERLVGMITDRDITVRAVAEGRDPERTQVQECMSPGVAYCFEDEELEQAQDTMKENQVRRLPVVSREKKLVGILAIGDLAIKTDEVKEVGSTVQEISELPKRVNLASE